MPCKGDFKKNPSKRTKQQREYDGRPAVKKKRAQTNKARRQAEADGKVKKGDGKDVDHIKPLRDGGSNAKSNLRVRDRSANRSDNGGRGGRPKKGRGKRGTK
jgi:hypothetical protein